MITKNLYDYIFAQLSSIFFFGLESKDFSIAKNSVVLFGFFTRQVAEIQILFFEPRFFVNLDMVAMVAHEKKEVLQIIYYQYQKFDTNFDNNPCCTD